MNTDETRIDEPEVLPLEIIREIAWQQRKMGYPESVPKWACRPNARGKLVWQHHDSLTVADCEQLVEYRSRLARRALLRWRREGAIVGARSMRTAAGHILLARLYRCQYLYLIGQEYSTEADMPFPCERMQGSGTGD
jgi:hypothetical protein